MVVAAYLTMLSALQRFTGSGAAVALGSSLGGTQEAILGYLLLTFPSGRATNTPTGWIARLVLVIAAVLALADLLTRPNSDCFNAYGFCTDQPNPFLVVNLHTAVLQVIAVGYPASSAVILAAVIWRFASVRGAARNALAPVLIVGSLAALSVLLRDVQPLGDLETRTVISRGAEVLIPIALGVGFMRSRMARGGVAELLVSTGSHPTPRDLESAIRRMLHDPTAQLVRWSDMTGTYHDVDGHPTRVGPGDDRVLTEIVDRDQLLGAIEHDPILSEEADLMASVAAAARIVMANELLSSSVAAQAADVARLPRGVVTMMRTDIEGSTELLAHLREQYPGLLLELRKLLRQATRHAGGMEIDSRADEFFAAFPDPVAGVRTAIAIQREVAARAWPESSVVRVRIGLHTGEPELTSEGYVGLDVHLAARVSATGSGGQIVISDVTRSALGGEIAADSLHDLGHYVLKGIPNPVRLFQVDVPGSEVGFPVLRAERLAD